MLGKDVTSPTEVTLYTGHQKSPRLSWVSVDGHSKIVGFGGIRERSQELFLLQTGGNTASIRTEEMGGVSEQLWEVNAGSGWWWPAVSFNIFVRLQWQQKTVCMYTHLVLLLIKESFSRSWITSLPLIKKQGWVDTTFIQLLRYLPRVMGNQWQWQT